jgi:hypothetical protein
MHEVWGTRQCAFYEVVDGRDLQSEDVDEVSLGEDALLFACRELVYRGDRRRAIGAKHRPLKVRGRPVRTRSGASSLLAAQYNAALQDSHESSSSVELRPSASGLSLARLKANINQTLPAQIYYDGASWRQAYGGTQGGAVSTNAAITSLTYANGNLTINHDSLNGADVAVTAFSRFGSAPPYIPIVRQVDVTSLVIGFIDAIGNSLYAGEPNPSMSLLLRKNFAEGILLDGTNGSASYDLDAGNIWFIGFFEL